MLIDARSAYSIRPASVSDQALLWEMLHLSLYVRIGDPRKILDPRIAI